MVNDNEEQTPRVFRPGADNIPQNEKGDPVSGGPWIRVDGLEYRITEPFKPATDPAKTFDVQQRGDTSYLVSRTAEKLVYTEDTPKARQTLYDSGYGASAKLMAEDASAVIEKSTRAAGHFHAMNSRLAVSDTEGRTFVAWDTDLNRNAVREAGFKPGSAVLWVPLANGEQLVDPAAREAYERIRTLNQSANDFDLKTITDVTGKEYNLPDGKDRGKVPANHRHAGHYSVAKTGVVAFVDTEGKTHIGLRHDPHLRTFDLTERLESAGYRKTSALRVPFSRGERPADDTDRRFAKEIARIQDTMAYKAGMKSLGSEPALDDDQRGLLKALQDHAKREEPVTLLRKPAPSTKNR